MKSDPTINETGFETSFLAPKKWILWLILALVFGLGLGIRLYDLFDAPLDFHPTRQMHSALIARGMYYQALEEAPDWQREMALRQWKTEPHPEPQFLERLVALTYQLIGSDKLWVARLYSILFWMAGAAALFLLAKEIIGQDGALVALIYFLILPYGAIASRSFQPDPLMVSLLIFTWWAALRWRQKPTWGRTVLAGVLGGLAIYIKAVAVFFVAGAWLGLLFSSFSLREILRSRQVWVIGLLTILPYLAFYVHGMYLDGYLRSEFGLRFFPQLWKDGVFYLRWNSELSSVVGFEWFLVAAACTLLLRRRWGRSMLLGLWAGYFVYGMTLSYHISTHDYYQLPLIPLVALGLGAGAQLLFKSLQGNRALRTALVAGVLLFFIVIKAWDVRVALKRTNYTNEIRFWQTFGERLGKEAAVVGLLQDAGARLGYWGWVDADDWMTAADFNLRSLAGQQIDTPALFAEAIEGKDYFVVTLLDELNRQPQLTELLSQYAVIEKSSDAIIYDLRQSAGQSP